MSSLYPTRVSGLTENTALFIASGSDKTVRFASVVDGLQVLQYLHKLLRVPANSTAPPSITVASIITRLGNKQWYTPDGQAPLWSPPPCPRAWLLLHSPPMVRPHLDNLSPNASIGAIVDTVFKFIDANSARRASAIGFDYMVDCFVNFGVSIARLIRAFIYAALAGTIVFFAVGDARWVRYVRPTPRHDGTRERTYIAGINCIGISSPREGPSFSQMIALVDYATVVESVLPDASSDRAVARSQRDHARLEDYYHSFLANPGIRAPIITAYKAAKDEVHFDAEDRAAEIDARSARAAEADAFASSVFADAPLRRLDPLTEESDDPMTGARHDARTLMDIDDLDIVDSWDGRN